MKSHQTRRFRTLPVGHKAVWLELPIAKVWCQECLATRQVEVTFAKPKKHYTKTFARFVVELSGFMTPMDIACFLGISWDTARDILLEGASGEEVRSGLPPVLRARSKARRVQDEERE